MSRAVMLLLVCAGASAPAMGQVDLLPQGSGGYSQNFDSMGQTGTTPPAGWTIWTLPGSNTTFNANTGIPAAAVSGGTQTAPTGLLGVFTQTAGSPTAGSNNNNGFNFGISGAGFDANDRALGLSTTNVAAGVIQLSLRNRTGGDLSVFNVTYDLKTFTPFGTAGNQNELPGMFFFVGTSGAAGAFAEVTALRSNPGQTPAVGSSITVSGTVTLSTPIADGGEVLLRWVDDNASQTSPDRPLFGIDNVTVTPTPGGAALLGLGGLIATRRRRV